MENYTITQLSKMFNTTRNTIYQKFSEASIQQYLHTNDKGHRTLSPEGMNIFTMLMANSKAGAYKQEINDSDEHQTNQDNYIGSLQEHIRILGEQLEFMKRQLERAETEKADMMRRFDCVNDAYIEITKPKKLLMWFGQKK